MGINGIATNYFATGYTNNEAAKAEAGKSFAEIASQKASEADKETVQEKTPEIIDLIGPNAPDEVKQAWMEAEEEKGVHIAKGGLYITPDGKHAYFTQLAGQPTRSIDEQRMIMNERAFYELFLEKLKGLS